MGVYEYLMEKQGAVPLGAKPKTVLEPGGEPGHYPQDRLSRMARTLQRYMQKIEENQEKARLKAEKQLDMYKTLREAGYDSKRATEAVRKMEFPEEPGGLPVKERKAEAEISKIEAETAVKEEELTLGPKDRRFTAEQKEKRRIGKQQVIQTIKSWGRTGKIWSEAEDDYIPVKNEATLRQVIIDQTDVSPYFDLEDKQIQTALADAVKARIGVDLKKDAKKEGKSLFQKIKEWLGIGGVKEKVKSDTDLRNEATQILKDRGDPVVEENILFIMDQLRNQ